MNRSRPFHFRSLVDTAVFLAVLAIVNHVWFRHVPAFRAYALHPYLLPIALVGLFYGFREALASVLLCNVAYGLELTVAGFPATQVFSQPDLANVLSFLVAGVFFGEAGELYQRALFHHREKSAELETSLAAVTEERNRLEASNRELEEWIRFGDVQLTEIHAAADDLFSFDEARVLDVAAPLAQKIVGAEQCALYLYDRSRGRFWRRSEAGQGATANPATIAQDAVPFSRLLDAPAVLSVRDVEGMTPGVTFMAAAPITVGGALHAVLLVEALPLVRLTPYTLANLGFLADLLNRCLDQATQNAEDVQPGLEGWSAFRERVEQEVHAANRYKEDLSLIFMDIRNFQQTASDLGPDLSNSLLRQIIAVVERNKRRSDILSYQGNGRLALLMPQTSPAKTAAYIERTREQINALPVPSEQVNHLDVAFSLGSQTLTDSGLRRDVPPAGR